MAAYELCTEYWSDPDAKAAFKSFVRSIHGLDFTSWDEAGFWDADYRPFTFFDRGHVISSVCIYSMKMVVEGRPVRVAQISGVGTLPEYRRRGLVRDLTDAGVRWARETGHEFFFLFANDPAIPVYRAMGFVPAGEHEAVLRVDGRPPLGGVRRLRPENPADLALIFRKAQSRTAVSLRLGILNERLLMFHFLNGLGDSAFFVEPLDLVVLASRSGGVLTVFDLIADRMPPFSEIYPCISDAGDREIVFRFSPDRLDPPDELEFRVIRGDNLHLSADSPLTPPVVFPYTAHA